MLALIPLIPLLPFLGFAVNGLGRRWLSRRAVALIACGAVLLAFLLSAGAVIDLAGGGAQRYQGREGFEVASDPLRFETIVATWIPAGPFAGARGLADPDGFLRVDYGFQLDPLSAVMILVVTGVGFLIHVYSTGYMAHEQGYARFFTYLNLFMGMMLVLVLANNFLLMFVGWEGVGLCSYLLIGFFTDRMFDERTGLSCADAGRKAFITNRVGDFAFMLGVLLILFFFHTLDFSSVMGAIDAGSVGLYGSAFLTVAGILLFLGACGKSAQIPLYVWLPDAMAGPTPVSALIHAATMVTAGVYMLARASALYWHAPGAMMVVAVVGCATAVFAATMGLAQTDIKKVLAYSTVSQLGFMFLGAGVGAFVASIFHLMTHAFFKACLFLGSGSVIHALGGEQDIRKMGGLKRHLPATYKTFLVATIAIAGIPPLAGFFSKDEILFSSLASVRGHWLLWASGSAAALCTAFYMFRLVHLTFDGAFRGTHEQEHHLHESPRAMTVPLIVLASLAAVGGLIGVPRFLTAGVDLNLFERWLHPTVAYHGAPLAEIQAARALRESRGAGPAILPGRDTVSEGREGLGRRDDQASSGSELGPLPISTAGTVRGSVTMTGRADLMHARASRESRGEGPVILLTHDEAPQGPEGQSRRADARQAEGSRLDGAVDGHGRERAEHDPAGAEHGGGGVEASVHYSAPAEWGLVGIAVLVALAGIGLARQLYINRPELPAVVAARAGAVYRLIAGKYYVDELYEAVVLRPFYGLCHLFHWVDRWLIDGAVNGARHLTIGLCHVSNFYDRWVVDLAVNGVGALVRGSSFVLRRAQTGFVQNYAAAMILGSFVLLGMYLVFR